MMKKVLGLGLSILVSQQALGFNGYYTNTAAHVWFKSNVIYTETVSAMRRFFQGDALSQSGKKIYVSTATGSDTTGDGSLALPYKTISKALTTVNPAQLGAETSFNIIIKEGIYREKVDLSTTQLGTSGVPIVIQAADQEMVFIKGSDIVSGWTSLGNGLFSKSYCVTNNTSSKTYSPCEPVEQVFFNRRMLQQYAGLVFDGFPSNPNSSYRSAVLGLSIWQSRITGDQNSLTDYSFYYTSSLDGNNQPQGTLYVKLPSTVTDLSLDTLEVGKRYYVFDTNGISNVTVRNLNFEHSNTTSVITHATGGVRIFNSNNVLFEKNSIAFMDGTGISINSWNSTTNTGYDPTGVVVQDCDISFTGHIGIAGWGDGLTIQRNKVSYNNLRGFNYNWSSAGIKFAGVGGLKNSQIKDNHIFRNYASGFWCDYCYVGGNTISGNRIFYNDIFGIHYEVSKGGTFTSNYIFGNGSHGVYHRESVDSTYNGNYILYHQNYGLSVFDDFYATTSRAVSQFGKPVSDNFITNNKMAFGNMNLTNGSSAYQLDWYSLNSSSGNTVVVKTGFPWAIGSRNGSSSGVYTGNTWWVGKLNDWKTKTGYDTTGSYYEKDPAVVTLSGDTESLQTKMTLKRNLTASQVQSFFTIFAAP